jgi:hypothetical protein
MPTLMWIAFWSCMMGAATCWGEAIEPTRRKDAKQTDRRDHPAS